MMSIYARNAVLPMQKLLNRQTQTKRRDKGKPVARPLGRDAGSWKTPTFLQPPNKNGGASSRTRAASRVAHEKALPSQPPRSVTFEDTNELSQLTLSQDLDSLPSSSVCDNKQSTLRLGQDSLSTHSREDNSTVASRSHAPTVVSSASSRPSQGVQSVSSQRSSTRNKLLKMMVTPHPPRRMTRRATKAAASIAPSVRSQRQQAIQERRSGSSLDGSRSRQSSQVEPEVRDPRSQERAVSSLQEQERKVIQAVQEEERRACKTLGEQELKITKKFHDQEENARNSFREQEENARVNFRQQEETARNNFRQQEETAIRKLDDYREQICKDMRELKGEHKALRKCLDTATKQHTVRERELDAKASKVSSLIEVAKAAHSKLDSALTTIANARDDLVASALPYLVEPVTKFVRTLVIPGYPASVSGSSSIEPSPMKSPQPSSETKSLTKRKAVATVIPKAKPPKRQRLALDNAPMTSGRKTVKPRTTHARTNKRAKSPQQPLAVVDTNTEAFVTRGRQSSTTKHVRSPMSLASCVTPCIPRDDNVVDSPASPVSSKKRLGVAPGPNRGRRKAFGANRPRNTAFSSDSYGFLCSE